MELDPESDFDDFHFAPKGDYAMAQGVAFLAGGARNGTGCDIARDRKRGIPEKEAQKASLAFAELDGAGVPYQARASELEEPASYGEPSPCQSADAYPKLEKAPGFPQIIRASSIESGFHEFNRSIGDEAASNARIREGCTR